METWKNLISLKPEKNKVFFKPQRSRVLSPDMSINFHFNLTKNNKENRYFAAGLLTGFLAGMVIGITKLK